MNGFYNNVILTNDEFFDKLSWFSHDKEKLVRLRSGYLHMPVDSEKIGVKTLREIYVSQYIEHANSFISRHGIDVYHRVIYSNSVYQEVGRFREQLFGNGLCKEEIG